MKTYIPPTYPSFFQIIIILLITLQIRSQNMYYTQTLDHFGSANLTFQQRLVVDSTYWAGHEKHGPILVYLGAEESIEHSLYQIGIISNSAPHLRALVVYIEHRFYGTSIPLGSIDVALQTPYVRSCLNSAQALADYAEIIISLKANLSAAKSPVIFIGGSYGGMLAAWFRLKYPRIIIGALASSAPILFSEKLPQQDEYCSIVGRDFQHVNNRCHDMITKSWTIIDEMGSTSNGLDLLKHKFNLCSDLNSLTELKEYLIGLYSNAAQYNGINNYQINGLICHAIVEAPDDDILTGIANAVAVIRDNQKCNNLDSGSGKSITEIIDKDSQKAWSWQVCSELVQRQECTGDNQIFPQKTFDLSEFMSDCRFLYGTLPSPHSVSTYYGRKDIKIYLKKFGSNIIFSNGLMDPFSGASILYSISNTIVALNTKEGSHCLDLNQEQSDDPRWLQDQRKNEVKIFEKWIKEYEIATGIIVDSGCRQTIPSKAILLIFYALICMLH